MTIPVLAALAVLSASSLHAHVADPDERAKSLGIPNLEEMAGDWTPVRDIANPTSLHNGHFMMIADRDLTSYFFHPKGWLYNLAAYASEAEPAVWKRGHPAIRLKIDGIEYPAEEAKQSFYRILRRNQHCNGFFVETDTRMVNEERGILGRVIVRNTTSVERKARLSLTMPGGIQSDGVSVANAFQRSGVTSFVAPVRKPDSVETDACIVATWIWNVDLQPGGEFVIEYAAGDEHTAVRDTDGFVQGKVKDEEPVGMQAKVKKWVAGFNAAFAACRESRSTRWADAFTPHNSHFSGNLPVLLTKNSALKRNYYMGAMSFLSVERTQFALHPRSFITQGERDDGTAFYGDIAMTSLVWALLEPEGMKATLRRWLVQNPRNGAWLDLRQTSGFDAEHYDVMHGYATNAFFIFRTLDEYLRVTGDMAFLDVKLEDGKTVLERMEFYANDWKSLPKGHDGLVDFGPNECLLECVPHYAHCVASMQAVSVWMLRRMADWMDYRQAGGKAEELRHEAAQWVPRVQSLYVPGEGVWRAWNAPESSQVVRHCNDFSFIGGYFVPDLSADQKREMANFAKSELICRDWMRALSLRDEAGRYAHRADHGQQGAFDAWVPWTIAALWRLGDTKEAFDFYCRVAAVTREGPFTQTHEFYGPTWDKPDAPVRISSARGNMRESVGGAGFASVVIGTFFGFDPSISGDRIISDSSTPRPFEGTLRNVRFRQRQVTLEAGPKGVAVK